MAKKKITSLRKYFDEILTKIAPYVYSRHVWEQQDQDRLAEIFDEVVKYHEREVKQAYERGKAEQSLFFGEKAEA